MQPHPIDEADEDQALEAAMRRRHRAQKIIIPIFFVALAIFALSALFELRLKHTIYNIKLKLAAINAPTPVAFADTDVLTKHHSKLLADWFILQSRAKDEPSQQRAAAAYKLMLDNLKHDKVAQQIYGELLRLVLDPARLRENTTAIMETIAQWNLHMDRQRQTWWVDANILSSDQGAFFYTKSYKIVSDVKVSVGAQTHRTRIVARADHTNIRESLLGHTSPHHEGAIILADRIYDFTLQDVWPLLASEPEGLKPVATAYASYVRQEASRALSPERFELLAQAATARAQLTRTIDQLRARRSCGSRFILRDPAWDGVPTKDHELLRSYARRDRFSKCPSITAQEADAIITASEQLRDQAELKDAVEALAAFVSRGVSIHEARHASDHAQLGDFGEPLPCERCDGVLFASGRAELSAYLASFSDESQGYTALFQACSIDLARATPHASAMRVFLRETKLPGCDSPPPPDLVKQARELEMQFFGRSQAVKLPSNYPERLELYEPPTQEP